MSTEPDSGADTVAEGAPVASIDSDSQAATEAAVATGPGAPSTNGFGGMEPGDVRAFASGHGPEPLINELRHHPHGGPQLPPVGVPERDLDDLIPKSRRRRVALGLPTTSEPEVLRHFGRLARRTFSLQQGLYPLGSCTMKYNPAVNEALARLDGFAQIHPYQPEDTVQGALRLMFELEGWLREITGMDRISLQPAAGAHGEWTGLRIIQAFHKDQGQGVQRDTVLVPDSAHGTNPASATLAGLKAVTVKSTTQGLVDIDDYRAKLGPHVAAVMLTNPNTLGLFERDITEIAGLAHEAGALLYYDGANLNALVGIARPGDMGFDVVHLNLHKTFSTPHGGGGPGAGPCGVKARLAKYLPVPTVERHEGREDFYLDWDRPGSIGKVRSFVGNFAVLVKAYAYMRAYGGEGLRQVAMDAVLNANYLKARLRRTFDVASDEPSLHEFVLTTRKAKELGVRNIDLAKRLLDYGFYAPTVSFPLTVPEALMVEPTETESRETLDSFVAAVERIWTEVQTDPDMVRHAPHETPVGRLDEVRAARHPKLTWRG
ncbi:MAG TPA: aminomethyl-transferring glycine dehydrogenase subunit GcvPB [Candidatus Dormibacteraeota bacterium]|nr:aminomethyl-transferring glycine dehydrogenase subunit GcvPB [Candidatus Dormibacteraeota bacterium]